MSTLPGRGSVPPAARPPAAPAAPAASGSPAGSPSARRPINPFLNNDPNVKARRLARALVSDLTAYYPDKRREGLASGRLKELFKEEIKKSWEEYVEQVGKDFAENTSHFRDALNEILAGGAKVF